MNRDHIEKTGLILDRLLMESPEFVSNASHSESEPKIIIKSNEDFRKNLKNINLLLYLKYPSVISLASWDLQLDEDEDDDEKLINLYTKPTDSELISLYEIFNKDKKSGSSNETKEPEDLCIKLTSTDKILILYGIAKAICHFQSKFVVHNQLNLNNIYITSTGQNKYFYPKIHNFENSIVFYDPNTIKLDSFIQDVKSFRKLIIEILLEKVIIDDVNNESLCKELDSVSINDSTKALIKNAIESDKDPVTTIRQFAKDIEDKKIWFDDINESIFDAYKQSFQNFKSQKANDNSGVFEIVQECSNNNTDQSLIQMIEKLINKSSYGSTMADFILGICYLKGIGIPQNFGIGYYYISRAGTNVTSARALKIILEQKAFVLESDETSTTLYQKGQIYECQRKYVNAYNCYIKSIRKASTEHKSYIPSFGRVGSFLLNQAKGNIQIEMVAIDYLKVGFDNDDPYATFELHLYFLSKGKKEVSEEIANKFGIMDKNQILRNAPNLSDHFRKKAELLGLPAGKMKTS